MWEQADGLPASGDVLPLHRHLLASGTVVVAERAGGLVGFGAVVERDGVVELSDLFVVDQGEGLGRSILDDLRRRHPSPSWLTVASSHPAARALYEQVGMRRVCDVVHLRGTVEAAPSAASPMVRLRAVDGTVATWICERYGADRRADVAYWASLGALAVCVDGDGDGGVDGWSGVALVCPHTPWHPVGDSVRLGPIVADHADAARALVDVALTVAAEFAAGARPVRLVLPDVHPAFDAVRERGLREVDRDTLMATDPGLVDPVRRVGAADLW